MDDGLQRFVELIAAIDDGDLRALHDATEQAAQVVPGLLAWLEHAIGWELDRRAGFDYRLGWPAEAIPPEEEAASVVAARAMAVPFRHTVERDTSAIAHLLEHVATLIASDDRTLN